MDLEAYGRIKRELDARKVTLIAVSKTKPTEDIMALYALGQRDFGENYVQELVEKEAALPKDIRWHFIGHLQTNKIKYIVPFVTDIQGVDNFKKLAEINKFALRHNRVVDCLLQMHIASEETKFGMDETDLVEFMSFYNAQRAQMKHVRIRGMMGMASNTENFEKVRGEFRKLKTIFDMTREAHFIASDYFNELSMGMSHDYTVAVEEGSTMVRIGSLLFGARNYNK